jgi:hypothetical protein
MHNSKSPCAISCPINQKKITATVSEEFLLGVTTIQENK